MAIWGVIFNFTVRIYMGCTIADFKLINPHNEGQLVDPGLGRIPRKEEAAAGILASEEFLGLHINFVLYLNHGSNH